MRKLLNTLYITKEDLYLSRDGSNVVIKQDGIKIGQMPIQYLEAIVCFTYVGISSSLMELSMENNVPISFLSPWGKFRGRIEGPIKGNVLLRKEQYRISELQEEAIIYARTFILGKIYNSIKVLQRFLRDHPQTDDREMIAEKVECLRKSKSEVVKCESLELLFGLEGEASRNYFSCLNSLVKNPNFIFTNRMRRPPTDEINAMLSLGYGLLRVRIENALETVGLDPYVGFLHQDRPGRTSFALDLMEELRAYMVDRFVISIVNLGQIKLEDFVVKENKAVLFSEDGFKKVIDLWNKRLQETVTHPFLEESVEIGLIPYTQAMLLARTIRGDLESYPPYFMN